MLYFERKFRRLGFDLIIGADEAGRGPLAGPVVAAAVALKTWHFKNRVYDSKKLNPIQRELAFPEIINKSLFGLGVVSESVIDKINILQATRLAMKQAVDSLLENSQSGNYKNVCLLIDGNMSLDVQLPCLSIVRGDSRSKTIAAASVLAKVTRDRIMGKYDKVYPQYGFLKHKGYPTKEHYLAIKKFGPSIIHRMTFEGV